MKIESTTKNKVITVEYVIKDVPNYGEVIYTDFYTEDGRIYDCQLRSVFGDDLLVEGECEQLLEDIQDLVGETPVDLSK
jgi:hypothetical protein